jgi:CHAT domain-containing protein/Tfp pilus assembly protein PilF
MRKQYLRTSPNKRLLMKLPADAVCLAPLGLSLAVVFILVTFAGRLPLVMGQAGQSSLPSLIQSPGQTNDTPELKPDEVIERNLAGGETHRYQIALSAGQFLQLAAEQRGIDVMVAFIGPDGKRLVEMDSPNGSQGPELLLWVTGAGGNHYVEVSSLDKGAAPGRYQLKMEGLRTALPSDNDRVRAQGLFIEGRDLIAQSTAESLRKGIAKFEEALPLWRSPDDRQREIFTRIFIGSALDDLSEYQKALECYFPLLELVRAAGDRVGEADTLGNIGGEYYSLGENQKALDYYNQSLILGRSLGNEMNVSPLMNNIALLYQGQGEPHRALEYFSQSLPLLRKSGDRRGLAIILNNIGMLYVELGEHQTALNYYNEALPLNQATGDRQSESITLVNFGALYEAGGDYESALNYDTRALDLSRVIGHRRGEGIALNNIGGIYNSLNDPQKALEYLNQALPIMQALGEKSVSGRIINNIGLAYSSLADNEKALEYFNRALTLMHEVGDRRGESQALGNIGTIYDSLGDQKKALEYYEQALPIKRETEDRRGEALILNYLGSTTTSLGDNQKALNYYNQALVLSQAVKDRHLEAASLRGVARSERNLGNLAKARERIETALSLIETTRARFVNADLRTSYFASVQEYYDLEIDVLMRLHQSQPAGGFDAAAVETSERARSRSLLELLSESRADIRQDVDQTLLQRERLLQQSINAKAERQTQLLNRKHTDEEAAVFQQEIEELLSQYHEVQARIRTNSPRYAALTQPVSFSLKEIQQQLLDPDTLLLEYRLGDEGSFLWAVTKNSLASFPLPKRTEVEVAARRVYDLLTARNQRVKFETTDERKARIARADADFAGAAKSLSEMLLSPVAAQLGTKRLLIVSDGALNYIPFAALPSPSNAQQPAVAGPQPLIAEHEIVNLPSALSLAIQRRELTGRKPAAKTLAVFADPVFDKDDERVKTSKSTNRPPTQTVASNTQNPTRSVSLDVLHSAQDTGVGDASVKIQRLTYTRREAKQITALVPQSARKEALDFDANRAAATNPELSQYRYVHFATHGFLNSVHPELSGIVLSLVDADGVDQDGFLRSYEIFNLKLPAELVVLSGCRTGLGKEIKGEGLVGLTRGFMYAGAARVLVSLWDISDEASAKLMTELYREMLGKERLHPAAALRGAQIKIWKEEQYRAPYYWAPFVLQGEPR